MMACIYKNRVWENMWCPMTCFYCTGEQQRTCKYNKATNADRIRAMSDKELAYFIADKYVRESCLRLTDQGYEPTATQIESTKNALYCCWMNWLQQPAEEK